MAKQETEAALSVSLSLALFFLFAEGRVSREEQKKNCFFADADTETRGKKLIHYFSFLSLAFSWALLARIPLSLERREEILLLKIAEE